ncbi:MAG: hypothetical protein A2Y62_02840 [Candidatus Fischerbacteria bacterium RBG_13_37_8]|uniref:histidine kinase n=1 Tax=Candidatus Fischerbacteria bacterium RBG_13_37_8 TaxID=1817863 RepID=A0A1F5VXV0_9BACT|nr:MAG: hypothetical protein A2Y62_02840 [Candidatus Fischerbacteria bacterium RBG_13_37_8]
MNDKQIKEMNSKNSQEDSPQSELLSRHLFEHNLAGVFCTTFDGVIIACNQAFAHIFGYDSQQEAMSHSAWDLYFSKDERIDFLSLLNIKGQIINYESQMKKKNGEIIWVLENSVLMYDEKTGSSSIMGILIDITEHRKAIEALRQSEERFREIYQYSPLGIALSDLDYRFIKCNESFCTMMGYAEEELCNMTFKDITHEEHLSIDAENINKLKEGINQYYKTEKRYKRRNGDILWASTTVTLIRDEHQVPLHFIAMVEDISQRKKTELEKEHMQEQLLQVQKLEAVGLLAGGIAHDFNNLLTTIIGYAELGMSKVKDEEPIMNNLKHIHSDSMRGVKLIRQLLLFSRKQPMSHELLNLNSIINDMLSLLERLIGENIDTEMNLGSDLWSIKGDKGNIEQVIVNLIINARDSMPQGGKIFITTDNISLNERHCAVYPGSMPGDYVCMSITDTGVGMSQDVVQHIFEPFFTTKSEGTGMGLAVIYGIIKQHNGWIQVYSEPRKGSAFNIFLPAFPEGQIISKREIESAEVHAGEGNRILLVEDEHQVRIFFTTVLKEGGYVVFPCKDAAEALRQFEIEQGNFDLIFCDIVLPDKNGIELVREFLSRKDDLRVLFCSGYTDGKLDAETIMNKGWPFLLKPITINQLLNKVKEVIL